MESSAAKLLTRAIELEQQSKYQPALVCYQEGIDFLFDALKTCKDTVKRKHYREKLEEYMTRAERVKELVNKLKAAGKYHDQTKIDANATGFCYKIVFGPYLDETVKEVEVEDPYIRSFHQINNFVRFCEIIVLQCINVKKICLLTTKDTEHNSQQTVGLNALCASLQQRNIVLSIDYSPSLHDREIKLSNGWIIKIGRGLDYFKKADKFTLGFNELSLRKCHETTIDIFHSESVK